MKTISSLIAIGLTAFGGCSEPNQNRVLPKVPIEVNKIQDWDHIIVSLKWNSDLNKCEIYINAMYCGYNKLGINKAKTILADAEDNKADIDAPGDVPMPWVVETLNMLMSLDFYEINFANAIEVGEDDMSGETK